MIVLRRRWNFKPILLTEIPSQKFASVKQRSGEFALVIWLGFIDVNEARQWAGAIPVKLQVESYSLDGGVAGGEWVDLKEGQYIQGCYTGLGVYGVLMDGVPRII